MKKTLLALLTAAALTTGSPVLSDEGESAMATVNGQPVSTVDVQTQTAQFVARGQEINEAQVLDELIGLELMQQEATRLGLDKGAKMESEMKIMRSRVLANALLTRYTDELDMSDEAMQAEYERQIALIGAKEYKASHILVDEEAKAKEIITELDGGADFAESAKKYSTGPSGPKGGDLGWFDAALLIAPPGAG